MRPVLAFLALAAALAACSGGSTSARDVLPDVRLPTVGGPLGDSLAACPTGRCLTVVVAPWCEVCRAEAPNIVQLRRYLDSVGVASRVVVGESSDAKAVRSFAAEFGADAQMDDDGALDVRATPTLFVSDDRGRLLKVVEGFPSGTSGPAQLAQYLGLISSRSKTDSGDKIL
ncbi:MAG: TlpA family protein disulfide reductase [Elusimicrobia bacterium]|nr:TlpA family protein disulfide reductase [Elusimicrobiota bacterium]